MKYFFGDGYSKEEISQSEFKNKILDSKFRIFHARNARRRIFNLMLGENEQIDPLDVEAATGARYYTYHNDADDSGVK